MEQNNNGTEQGEKNQLVREVADKKYEYGFTTDVHTEIIERGLNEDVIRLISSKKGEPEWLLPSLSKVFISSGSISLLPSSFCFLVGSA